jgi:aminoglycoside 6'-N-acetyltransferase I
MTKSHVRLGVPADLDELAHMLAALWPDASAEEHAAEIAPILAGRPPGTLPLVLLAAEGDNGTLTGFLEVGLRSHADGCDTRQPVGFIEGWFVLENHRRKGIGSQLIAAAEDWARSKGCVEMASDTWLDDEMSLQAHAALGYEVVDRCIHFRKPL